VKESLRLPPVVARKAHRPLVPSSPSLSLSLLHRLGPRRSMRTILTRSPTPRSSGSTSRART
jgi:hypothetical protein